MPQRIATGWSHRHRRRARHQRRHGRAPRRRPNQRQAVTRTCAPSAWTRWIGSSASARRWCRPSRCPRCLSRAVGWLAYCHDTEGNIFGVMRTIRTRDGGRRPLAGINRRGNKTGGRWPSCVEFLIARLHQRSHAVETAANRCSRAAFSTRGLARGIEGALAKHFGFEVRVVYTTASELTHHCGESAARPRWMSRFSSRLPIPPRTSRRLVR